MIPLRLILQIAVALLLSIPTLFLGHLIAFGLAGIGDAIGPYPTSNFFYAAGEGLMASVCLAFVLYRITASTAARVWCWTTACILWVGAMPAWGVILVGEAMHFALIWILGIASFFAWLAWLPWWHPQWITSYRGLHLTTDHEQESESGPRE